MCLIALTAPLPALAAASGEPASLALVVSEAVRNNGELLALRDELGIVEAEADRAGLYPDPVFGAGLETGALTGNSDENRYSAELSREFLTFGKAGLRRAMTGKTLDAARERLRDAERLVALDVKTHFHGTLLAREQEALARRVADLDGNLVQIARQRFAAGDIAEIEVSLARVEESRARERVIATEQETVTRLAALGQLLGLPAGDTPRIAGTLETGKLTVEIPALIRKAQQERPDLRALRHQLEGGGIAVELARAEGRPNLTAGITYSYERSMTEIENLAESSADHLLGLRLSVPIPTPGRKAALLREATAARSAMERRLAALDAAIAREVATVAARLDAATRSLDLYRSEILPGLEANLETVREAYRLGETGILNVIEEQRRYHAVHSDHLRLLHDWNLALAALEAAVATNLTAYEGDQ